MKEFSLFQFEVDNASTVERSVSLLLAKLPTNPTWVLNYICMSQPSTIANEFLCTFVNRATTEDIPMLKDLLNISPGLFSYRLFLASPTPEITNALIEWQQERKEELWQSFAQDE
jgi:hypothetical protein